MLRAWSTMRRRRPAGGVFVPHFSLRRGRVRSGPSAEDLGVVRPGSGGARRLLWSFVQELHRSDLDPVQGRWRVGSGRRSILADGCSSSQVPVSDSGRLLRFLHAWGCSFFQCGLRLRFFSFAGAAGAGEQWRPSWWFSGLRCCTGFSFLAVLVCVLYSVLFLPMNICRLDIKKKWSSTKIGRARGSTH